MAAWMPRPIRQSVITASNVCVARVAWTTTIRSAPRIRLASSLVDQDSALRQQGLRF